MTPQVEVKEWISMAVLKGYRFELATPLTTTRNKISNYLRIFTILKLELEF